MKKFLIYKSSAGSGKTYTLVKEYLKLVLTNPDNFRSTLAVTFTNKAADEMKSRIIGSLEKLSQGKDKNLAKTLAEEGVKADIRLSAAAVLKMILHQYSYFSVSTIDSFFHRIIRSFSKELKLQLGFDIELDQKAVMDKITNDLLDDISYDAELRKYLEDFVFYNIGEDKGWKIENKIKDIAGEIFREKYWIKKEQNGDLADNRIKMNEFIGKLFAVVNDFEGKLQDIGTRALKIISTSGLEAGDFRQHTANYFEKVLKKEKYPDIEPTRTFKKTVSGEMQWFTKTSKKVQLIEKALDSGLQLLAEEVIHHTEKHFTGYITAYELVKTVYILGIFKDLIEKLKVYRDENKLMLISDTNNILNKVISGGDSPFIYEKTGNVYRHFLIDEFQDTSLFQWRNFRPLIENSLAENNFSMIVGDVKQSIYRWRNGDMKLLLSGVREDLAGFDEIIEEKNLSGNFRSKKEIVEFNNRFFKRAAEILAEKSSDSGKELILNAYSDVFQETGNCSEGGFIKVNFFEDDYAKELTSKEVSSDNVVKTVKELISSGYEQRDIMALTRRKEEGAELAACLSEAGISVISDDSLYLTNSPRVKLLISVLKYIANPEDNIARTEILYIYHSYIANNKSGSITNDKIFNDYKTPDKSLFFSSLPAGFYSGNGEEINPVLFRLGLYELVEKFTGIFELNRSADIYLLRFLDAVKEYISKYNSSYLQFIEWWEENKENISIIVPGNVDAVRVMTIHKAKGLESPVVILPYCNWEIGIKGNRDMIWATSSKPPFNESAFYIKAGKNTGKTYFENDYNEESVMSDLDNLNLLYVAFTRASRKLYINIPRKRVNSYNTGKLIDEVINGTDEVNMLPEKMQKNEKQPPDKSGRKNPEDGEAYKIDNLNCPGIAGNIKIKSSFGESEPDKIPGKDSKKEQGKILHKALAGIKTPEDCESSLLKLLYSGGITGAEFKELLPKVKEFVNTMSERGWFSKDYKVFNEAEILLPGGKLYRPDRVMVKDNLAVIIDFKTGKEKPEDKTQIKTYSDILKKMKYPKTEMYLYYTAHNDIIQVK